jgi:hypothetical protein
LVSLATLFVHDVVILTAGTTIDRYGNELQSWSTATSVSARGWITQMPGSEQLLNRDAQIAEWSLSVPAGTPITGHERVTWEGITFEVAGPPQRAWTPRGEHHVVAQLQVITG